ncbi:MAG: group II truncated hemoglobin [Lautropia sp.]
MKDAGHIGVAGAASPGEAAPADPATVYARLGGDAAVRRLVHRFYALMDELPEAWDVRKLHPASLEGSEQKLYKYLSGWFGGPPLYVRENGHPRLRWRHLPWAIGAHERDQWLMCMHAALREQVDDPALRDAIGKAFDDLADHMVNRRDPGAHDAAP